MMNLGIKSFIKLFLIERKSQRSGVQLFLLQNNIIIPNHLTGLIKKLNLRAEKLNKTIKNLAQFKDFYKEINGKFLTVVFSGVIASFFSVSLILDRLIEDYELYVFGLFFGMILVQIKRVIYLKNYSLILILSFPM